MKTQTWSTLEIGEGSINPDELIAQGIITASEVLEFCDRLQANEFVVEIDPSTIADSCVDGRGFEVGGNAAGGTFTLVIADALTTQTYWEPYDTALDHARRMYGRLQSLGKRVGGHTGPAEGANSGCGAQDKLDATDGNAPSILHYIVRRGDDIREFLADIGIRVDAGLHTAITTNAQKLRNEGYATSGKDIENVTKEVAGANATPFLPGEHRETVLDLETRPGKTMDRRKIYETYQGRMQAFHVDVWAIRNGITALTSSATEQQMQLIAALYYNVATACVLAKNVRLVVHEKQR